MKPATSTIILGLFILSLLTGCSIFDRKQTTPNYNEVHFSIDEPIKPLHRIADKNNPLDVIEFARSLSKAGRYKESAEVYLDAAKRFSSRSGDFGIYCRMSAVKEFWFSGDLSSAEQELNSLEHDQDIYSYSRESKSIRKLRKLLKETAESKNKNNMSKDDEKYTKI